MSSEHDHVLIADRRVAEASADRLADYEVTAVTNVEGVYDRLEEGIDPDVAVIDSRFHRDSDGALVGAIRDRDPECRIALVTGPEVDIVASPVADELLVRPVEGDALVRVVEGLLLRREYATQIDERFDLAARKAALEAAVAGADDGPAFAEVDERLQSVADELDETMARILQHTSILSLYADIGECTPRNDGSETGPRRLPTSQ